MRIHEVKTSSLRIAYEESGAAKGEPLLLLHGWPDSPRAWDKVLPALRDAGFRTIVPYLRGYGLSTFRRPLLGRRPARTGQPVALARDAVDLLDRLSLDRVHLIGHDWGANTGYAVAAVYPQRLKSLIALAVTFSPGKPQAPALPQARAYWYQWLLNTPAGEKLLRQDPIAFGQAQWDGWSPEGWYTQADLAEAAKSWQGKDYQDVVLQYYRARWNNADRDPRFQSLQDRFEATKSLSTPTLLIHGTNDTCTLTETTDGAYRHFTGRYRRVLIDGVGHFPHRERPLETVQAILTHLRENG